MDELSEIILAEVRALRAEVQQLREASRSHARLPEPSTERPTMTASQATKPWKCSISGVYKRLASNPSLGFKLFGQWRIYSDIRFDDTSGA